MPFVRANPTEFLLTGRGGRLENRGSAVQAYVLPGTVSVVVPAGKETATFEFTQETRDGIPLRFKGVIVYRVTDPLAAASQFDFTHRGLVTVSEVLTGLCLGELRHAVSHMTMAQCIEERKTTLSTVIATALSEVLHPADAADWGITVEIAQVAQVFIVDADLRAQLEAEVRNDIRLRSEQSGIRMAEQASLATMASSNRVEERRLAGDRDALRREESLEVARIERDRRLEIQRLESARQSLDVELARARAELEAEEQRIEAESPVRRLRVASETEDARSRQQLRRLEVALEALEVERRMAQPRAEHELRREILPLEQAPAIAGAASGLLHGTNLSIYGDGAEILGQLAPILDALGRAFSHAVPTRPAPPREHA